MLTELLLTPEERTRLTAKVHIARARVCVCNALEAEMQVNGRLSQEQRVWTDAAAASLTKAVQVLKAGGLTAEAEAIAEGSLATAEALLCQETD